MRALHEAEGLAPVSLLTGAFRFIESEKTKNIGQAPMSDRVTEVNSREGVQILAYNLIGRLPEGRRVGGASGLTQSAY
jgi:hypothetical protein